MKRILPIVEGEGDMAAVPVLLRRILEHHQHFDVQVLRPQRRGELVKVRSNFERFFEAALLEEAPILWVVDYDVAGCDCVVQDHQSLRHRAQQLRPDWPIEFAFMVQEFETMFLADKTASRSVLTRIPDTQAFPTDPEDIRDAKGWLSEAMPKGFAYKPTIHQAKIAHALNLPSLRDKSPSFAHLERAVLRLVEVTLP